MSSGNRVLVIGAGELGKEVLRALSHHSNHNTASISVLLRPTTISSTAPGKIQELKVLRQLGISLVPGDIVSNSEETLASIFKEFSLVIGCTGFVAGSGTQLKITRAVLTAEVPRYIPWQFGVDYDLIGRGSAQELFDEQLDVRDLLRSQTNTKWVILSTGMFTSFLFEPAVGIVDVEQSTVRALGGWDNSVSVTSPEDIGKLTAEAVLGDYGDKIFANEPIFVAGDTVSYGRVAEIVEKITQKSFARSVLTVAEAKAALAQDLTNALHKYNVVFGEGRGVAWDVSKTWNFKAGIPTSTAEEWARSNLK